MLSSLEIIVIGFVALVIISGIVYLVSHNRAYKRRMYEAALRRKRKAKSQATVEEVG